MNNIKSTAETLIEKPIWISIGFFLFKVKPLTLAQIWEIGALLENVELKTLDGEENVVTAMMNRYGLLKSCTDLLLIILFRSRWKRVIMRRYLSKRMNMIHYKKLIEFALMSFQAGFFLTSFTFLKGAKTIARTTSTAEATPLGDSSEE